MLTPKQVDEYAGRAAAKFDTLTENILKDTARRITKANYMTDTAKWQTERAKALGASTAYLLKQMAAIAATVSPAVAPIFAEAMLEADRQDAQRHGSAAPGYTPLGSSTAAQQLVNSGFRRTMSTLTNLTQTRAVMGNKYMPMTHQRQLADLLDQAHMKVASGAFSIDEAVRSSIKQLANDGLGAITYPSGHVDKLDVVVLRAMRTGINQTAGEITLHNAGEMGCDLMELTAHAGARTGDGHADMTNHSWWQGKLVSISGKPGYLSLTDIGYGDVQGFMGANCRHNWSPFFEGVSTRNWDAEALEALNEPCIPYNGRLLTEAEADEKQRALERRIRACKREYALYRESGLQDDAQAAAARLAQARARMDDFIRQTGRHKQQVRETVAGFGRSEASSAAWAARRDLHPLAGKIEAEPAAGYKLAEGVRKQFDAAARQFTDKIPLASKPHLRAGITGGDLAGYSDALHEVTFNKDVYTKADWKTRADKFIRRMHSRGQWSSANPNHAIWHELGHAWVRELRGSARQSVVIQKRLNEAYRLLSEARGSILDESDGKRILSVYGMQNDDEGIAECVAAYLAGDTRPLVTAVLDALIGG